jgi:hypothetical protein
MRLALLAATKGQRMKQDDTGRADRPRLSDRIMLRFSKSRYLDGLWIGTWEMEAEPILRRIEQALLLIKRYDRIRYDRLLRDLQRVWVLLLPSSTAIFEYRIYTCEIDTRYCLAQTTTPELLATVIVHEATHARLWRRGILYEEAQRPRIEEICVRREIAFAAKLPTGRPCATRRSERSRSALPASIGPAPHSASVTSKVASKSCVTWARPVGSRWSSAGSW